MKKRYNLFALVLIFCTFASITFAQVDINTFKDNNDIYQLDPALEIKEASFFETNKTQLGLTENDNFAPTSSEEDELKITHTRYKQFYKGYAVDGGDFILHSVDGYVVLANGEIIEELNINVTPSISEEEALNEAMNEIGAKEYAWQNAKWEEGKKIDEENELATYFPKAQIVIAKDYGAELVKENYHLAYKFIIETTIPSFSYEIYIDAQTGKTIKWYPLAIECTNYTGSCTTMYNGSQNFSVDKRVFDYRLEDCDRNIHTKIDQDFTNQWVWRDDVTDNNGNWGTDDQKATTVHWELQKAYDYYKNIHNRTGTDNAGKPVRVWADWWLDTDLDGDEEPNPNARYNGENANYDYIRVGTIYGNYLGALDVLGHELTHGVDQYTSNLAYENESGALDESFADIFGTAIEKYAQGGTYDWTIGEDAYTLRSMNNPPAFNQPEIYDGANWIDLAGCTPTQFNDYCYVHTNSGVQNKWFWLLSAGGTFNGVTVTGIGIDKAAKIAYRCRVSYLTSYSEYEDARTFSIQAAMDLYGICSSEVIQTTNAWAAVGVGGVSPNLLCVNIVGPNSVCEEEINDIDYVFNANAVYNGITNPTGVTFNWTPIPSGWTVSYSGTGNKTMTVTNISSPVTKTVFVTATHTATALTATDSHIFTIEQDCCPPLCRFGEDYSPNGLSILLFPNPTSGLLNYNFTSATSNVIITFYDTQGKLIYQIGTNESKGEIDISNFPAGIYLVKISDNFSTMSKFLQIIK